MRRVLGITLAVLFVASSAVARPPEREARRWAQNITKEALDFGGGKRTFYLFVPEKLEGKQAPLIIALHGSGRDGRILVDHWKSLASKEGIILAGPDATKREEWNTGDDGPAFLYALSEHLKSKYPVDPKRVYLFGHSAGAIHGLAMGVLESEYFAAIAAHAGVLPQAYAQYARQAPRKIPLGIWVGTNDRFFPLENVRQTRDAMVHLGFPTELTEIKGHTHDYYGRSGEINKAAWAFLQKQRLESEPKYQEYTINK